MSNRMLLAACAASFLFIAGCGMQEDPASACASVKGPVGKAVLYLPNLTSSGLAKSLALDSGRFEITIEAYDMTPMVYSWNLGDMPRSAVTIENIPAGWSRLFTGKLYDGSGTVTHEGQVYADIYSGQTVTIHLRLVRATGGGAVICIEVEGYPQPDCAPNANRCDTIQFGDSACVPTDSLWMQAYHYCISGGGTLDNFWFSGFCGDTAFARSITFVACFPDTVYPPPNPASLTVLSPNGGEYYRAGDTMLIEWVCDSSVSAVDIQLLAGDSVSPLTLASVVANPYNGGRGSMLWVIPDTIGYLYHRTGPINCIVRVASSFDPWGFDESDSSLTIELPLIDDFSGPCGLTPVHVNFPNGGEVFRIGDTVTISWCSESSQARPELSVDGGMNYVALTGRPILSDGSAARYFPWVVPRTLGNSRTISSRCLIRVIDSGDTTYSDISDSVFQIIR